MSDFSMSLKIQELINAQKSFVETGTKRFDAMQRQLDAIDAQRQRPTPGDYTGGGQFPNYQTPGEHFIKSADIELLKKTNRLNFRIEKGFHPAFETKTLIDSTALGYSTPGILGADRIQDSIVPLPRRRLTVRDLLRAKPVTGGQVDWIQELAFTNAASPQEEGESKGESANTFQIASEKVRTLAHWIPVSKQALDDLSELRRFIDENLIYGLKLIEENELLWGDGSGEHLHGLGHQATAYAGTYWVENDSKLDALRHAIAELEVADEECTAMILHPKDLHDIDCIKTLPNEYVPNTGSYVVGNPLGGLLRVRTLWGRPVVSTTAMVQGTFLMGNFANQIIGDRLPAVVEATDTHDDYWVKTRSPSAARNA